MDYLFTLTYQLNSGAPDSHALIEQLALAGCDDALVGLGRHGYLALAFTRDASSIETAINIARDHVHNALPTAVLIETKA